MTISRALALATLMATLAAPAAAKADFGLVPGSVSAVAKSKEGAIVRQAGSHPYSYEVSFALNKAPNEKTEGGEARDVIVDLPPGFVGNPLAVLRCTRAQFEGILPLCPPETQIGIFRAELPVGIAVGPVYNMVPPPGIPGQLAFGAAKFNAFLNATVRSEEGYGLEVATQLPTEVRSATVTIWGVPKDPSHDFQRGHSAGALGEAEPSSAPNQAFLTLPASCAQAPVLTVKVDSKSNPGDFGGDKTQSAPALDAEGQPAPMTGCGAVPFMPQISAQPTTRSAASATGLDFGLSLGNFGLLDPGSVAETEPEKVVVAFPEGVTVNPSAAEGIGTCSEAQYRAESPTYSPGAGCPPGSKIGSVTISSPLLDEAIEGSVYLATPYQNPTHSLIGAYLIARVGERGVIIKQAGKVEPDASTGQLLSSFEGLPPLPFSSIQLHLREGPRAPLVTPSACGSYRTSAQLYPFSTPAKATEKISSFTIDSGIGGGSCPSGPRPFNPGFEAGSMSNAAATFSPFYMHLSKKDGDQDLTRFSAKLPPGISAKLAGTSECSDAAIAQARSRTGQNGGAEEFASPSCPADSQIGRVVAGAGVGSALTYVSGRLYLAGPYQGAPLSVVSIVPAVAGPFDVGTVVTRVALRVDPATAEVEADGASADPIPHILKGIPLQVRDVQVFIDKPSFALNPTSCEPSATLATLWSGGSDPFSSADDTPHSLSSRFQAADCASLGFAPKFSLSFSGGVKRDKHPALKAVVTQLPGQANIARASVTLPSTEFIDQGHVGNPCTRPQFTEGKCPPISVLGTARAYSPLLDKPLTGKVYFRSNGGARELPDVVADLNGQVHIELVGFVDAVHKKGSEVSRIRNTFALTPDAPVSKFVLELKGGKAGLLVNSQNLCKTKVPQRALIKVKGHNGKEHNTEPLIANSCSKKKKTKEAKAAGRLHR